MAARARARPAVRLRWLREGAGSWSARPSTAHPASTPTITGSVGAYACLRAGDIARLKSGGSLFTELAPLSLVRLTAPTGRSIIARVADWGTGGPPIDGHVRAVDLWWQTSNTLGLPGTSGAWAGLVRIARPPQTGAGSLLDQTPAPASPATRRASRCAQAQAIDGLQLTPGQRARILPDGSAAAPAARARRGQGSDRRRQQDPHQALPEPSDPLRSNLGWSWPAYDCSASVSYVLYHAGLHGPDSRQTWPVALEDWGQPGPGRWITVYANSTHAFIVIAGLAFDTADYGGPNIPAGTGPRWRSNPLGNLADGLQYVARHPPGL